MIKPFITILAATSVINIFNIDPVFITVGEGPSEAIIIEEEPEIYYNENIPLDPTVQDYLYQKSTAAGIDFNFILSIMEIESGCHDENNSLVRFNKDAYHKNSNGSCDRGLFQINSCWTKKLKKLGYIETTEDLYNPYTNIDCAIWELTDCITKYGNTEKAYAYYNTGNPKVNSNKNSRKVMQYWEKWNKILKEK